MAFLCLTYRTRQNWCCGWRKCSACWLNRYFKPGGLQIGRHRHEKGSVPALVGDEGSSGERRVVIGSIEPSLINVSWGKGFQIAGEQNEAASRGLIYDLSVGLTALRSSQRRSRHVLCAKGLQRTLSFGEKYHLMGLFLLGNLQSIAKILRVDRNDCKDGRQSYRNDGGNRDPPPADGTRQGLRKRSMMDNNLGVWKRAQGDPPGLEPTTKRRRVVAHGLLGVTCGDRTANIDLESDVSESIR